MFVRRTMIHTVIFIVNDQGRFHTIPNLGSPRSRDNPVGRDGILWTGRDYQTIVFVFGRS